MTTDLEIDVNSVRELLQQEAIMLLDCREPAEWEAARISGATLIPMGEIAKRVGELPEAKDTRVVVYCHHGMRSLMVAEWLRQQGFSQTQSMAGGIDAWSVAIDPSVPRYG